MEEGYCMACGSTELVEYEATWHDGTKYKVKSCIWHTPLKIVSLGEFKWLTDMDQQKK